MKKAIQWLSKKELSLATSRILGLSVLSLVLASPLTYKFAQASTVTDETPVPAVGAEGGPSRVLTPAELDQWKRGRLVFDRDWDPKQGLGRPDMNADSCRACHQDPIIGGAGGLDLNVFRFAKDDGGTGPTVDLPGGQIASRLRNPLVQGREEHHDDADLFELRQAPSILGLGLIEGISDADILANADPTDSNGDGIYGVARMLMVNGSTEIGRFGWKAQVPSLEDFMRDASGEEVGLTTPDNGRPFGLTTDGDTAPDPEMSADDFADALFFMRELGAPPRRGNATKPEVIQGEEHFNQVGCATCHTPEFNGANGPVRPYSNFLLHNVHPADFRGMAEDGAGVGFYRTPPLWGISRTAPYMHDGSAEDLESAIAAHTGEAEQVIEAYNLLTPAQKAALVSFLKDL